MPVCQLCSTAESRYKCPTCFIPYCSLACYKPHKVSHELPHNNNNNNNNNNNSSSSSNNVHIFDSPAPPPTPASPQLAVHQPALTDNTLPPPPQTQATKNPTSTTATTATTTTSSRYSPLLSDPHILPFLKSNPSLHGLLYQVYLCTLQPPPSPQLAPHSSNPYKITKRVSTRHLWTPETGVSKGVKRLGRTRDKALAKGGNGGTLEEFVLMVLKCLGEGKPGGGGIESTGEGPSIVE